MFAAPFAYSAAEIRAAEAPLLAAEASPDALMQRAAHAVARVAREMSGPRERVLLLVGPGGNGGDALYAGAELAREGWHVNAWLPLGRAQQRALDAFVGAGGGVVEKPGVCDLLIDGLFGLGGAGDLPDAVADIEANQVLAVDVPSGVDADTGEAGRNALQADVTVTFGGWRYAHALSTRCGSALCADIGLPLPESDVRVYRAVPDTQLSLDGIRPMGPVPVDVKEPGAADDKYTGGVVGIHAGSGTYPGAALLCTAGAVTATPAMVRFAGAQALEVVRAHPEVVATRELEQAGQVQAWVCGPGIGLDEEADAAVDWVLRQGVPVVLDADALTLVARAPRRLEQVVVTPHDGEFSRLYRGMTKGRVEETVECARALGCTVVRKGRATVVSNGQETILIDAGSSWAATPGSGDVLAGILGARVARDGMDDVLLLAQSVQVHAVAAWLASLTPYGHAQTSASEIARNVRSATAWCTRF
ncbi:bifunctional ADP-dependent (S)-NAD(P)H-hydrate dehydratase/NAD(P)H-hydrate epimerase [Corynebacterium sp. NML140438]|uniref:bifunctional ADP-dependent NAD(P)H-hydrate dehydratase/NAD(P)H-hydrate epimerase n=1 Tax=Corynebacterium sp. NML140438 TaxID=1906334 RepID=UPI0008FB75B7|nr:bifunctional ADP-dependent NAD(P)H-hydrate dehydratase/NAD(P)H-hydrate epimerase [Corynebacterium sp. NML140438]OIR43124.1 bifunctional ADP-dependent (S)-NAD(P)H-hydrate dehydratase/NAD(P)H-hydrate epimerase [Corynebacterium sp. NML140438]